MDVLEHNRAAWDAEVESGNPWTKPVGPEEVARARSGDVRVVLTPKKPVPREWLGDLRGKDLLALASGGGQQAPLLAAAGARVTLLDNSPRQLAQDQLVAEREGLEIRLEQGDMRDLSRFGDASFDLVFHPVSNLFVPDVRPVWRECARVLRSGGELLAGFCNPVMFVFDPVAEDRGELALRYSIPYDARKLGEEERAAHAAIGIRALEFGHTLEDQIGGQLDAGLALVGMFEDGWGGDRPLDKHLPSFVATRARKP